MPIHHRLGFKHHQIGRDWYEYACLHVIQIDIFDAIPGSHVCQGLNSHYFHIIGDGHQPNSRGLYTHYKDSY